MEKKKMKNWKKCLITLIVIVLVLLGAFVSYELYLKISDKIDLDKKYEDFLKEIRSLLKDKERYLDTQRDYIAKLKQLKKL